MRSIKLFIKFFLVLAFVLLLGAYAFAQEEGTTEPIALEQEQALAQEVQEESEATEERIPPVQEPESHVEAANDADAQAEAADADETSAPFAQEDAEAAAEPAVANPKADECELTVLVEAEGLEGEFELVFVDASGTKYQMKVQVGENGLAKLPQGEYKLDIKAPDGYELPAIFMLGNKEFKLKDAFTLDDKTTFTLVFEKTQEATVEDVPAVDESEQSGTIEQGGEDAVEEAEPADSDAVEGNEIEGNTADEVAAVEEAEAEPAAEETAADETADAAPEMPVVPMLRATLRGASSEAAGAPWTEPPAVGSFLTHNGSIQIGTFEVTDWYSVTESGQYNTYFTVKLTDSYGLLHADGSAGTIQAGYSDGFRCADPGKGIPGSHPHSITNDQYGYFSAKVLSVGETSVTYEITCYPYTMDSSSSQYYTNMGLQRVQSSSFNVTYDWNGSFSLLKKSANPSMTNGNSCYSLEGAVYGVYTDYACENPVLDKNGDPVRLITNAAGQSNEVELPSAWYYVKEISAPKGYMLDDLAHDVQVTGESTVLELEDVPLNDPFAVRIQKVDANTGEPVAPGGASLALAEYTFDYYAGVYTSAEEARSSGAPTASYVMRTDGDGYVSLILGDESFDLDGHNYDYKVSGPDFIKDAMTGIITSPLGSWVVYETKAPKGFLLSDEVFFAVLDANAEGQVGWNAPNVFTDPNNPDEATFRALEAPAAYGIKLDKRLEGVPNETSPEGIRFDIVSKTTGETVVTLTIGADGTASTQEDTLPYDIYEVYEDESSLPKNESGDYLIQPFSWTNEDNSNLVATIDMADYDNGSIITVDACDYTSERIVVKKTDRDSGEAISGTRFQLWRYPASVVDGVIELDVNDISADDPAWENIGSVSTDSAGIADFGWKGYGIYKIVESQAATAYMNPSEMGEDGFIIFKLDKNNSYQEQVFTDKAINLGCEVSKSTLDVTSAGLIYRDVDGNEVSNVGVEEYRYDVTFRSTANTWADEFYVIDECQMTGKPYGLRITKLWLPTVSGDTDGRLHLLIRTGGNSAAGMSFSQPELHEGSLGTADRFDASGWDYVGEFSASSREAVDLSAYGDIKGIALCFGAVEEGFCSLEPLSYLVTATHELEAGTVIPNSVTSHISRNWSDGGNGLKDDDSDSVETRVISTFEVSFDEYVVERSGGTHGTWISRLLPQTGDGAPLLLFIVVLGLSLLGFITMLVYHTHGNRKEREG